METENKKIVSKEVFMTNKGFKKSEIIFISTLGFALGIRQMAMTMVMPFISIYSETLSYNTKFLAGVALGIFGLMQAIFQIPYGIWSDKKGNKLVMLIGLMQVIIGLGIAYFATNIYFLILARAMQGSGAVIAIGYSWIASTVDDEKRTNALSIIGVIIGVAASASFAFGPLIHRYISVKYMFLYSGLLITLAWIIILIFLKDNRNKKEINEIKVKKALNILIKDKNFIALNIIAFFNNFIMTAVFFAIPEYLEKITGVDGMWKVFMPAVIIAIVIMRITAKNSKNEQSINAIILSFIIISIGIVFYFNKNSFIAIFVGTVFFMVGYIEISTLAPSLGNFILKDSYRGIGNGFINSLQYVGSFMGAVVTAAIWAKSELLAFILIIIIAIAGAYISRKYINKEDFYEGEDIASLS
ncbi:Predicted arabinose efflux permease, MFS family [Clostridium cavendishii DSM 21758]|uniref:Predicted arabinose efflux permease, MFS family n=2 Tax=Clostridium TaxID=1485 RepID=A0A1M6L0B8_9CLOT|nr:Predicted arabinose efflux permease, MFS family [Clostridium cavendishii DSM 21758]